VSHPHAVRRAHRTEHAALVALWERSVRATHDFLTAPDIEQLRPRVGDALADPALELWVLTDAGDRPIGLLGLAGDDISALFLDADRRGQGGGRRLVEHAQALRGGALTVDVNEQNPAAVGFYEALGFTLRGRSPVDGDGRPFPLLHMHRPAPGAPEGV
jgi:putative acetyltransferase